MILYLHDFRQGENFHNDCHVDDFGVTQWPKSMQKTPSSWQWKQMEP
jgi:hypothetical protein